MARFCEIIKKIRLIPKIIETKKEQKTKKELHFLFKLIFQFYYDSLESATPSGIDFPEFVYEKRKKTQAQKIAFNELLYRVADKKVVGKLYAKGIKQFNGCKSCSTQASHPGLHKFKSL